jgi:hypothetical protein
MINLGGTISRNIKTRVIRQWLDGRTREQIRRENDIGAGTVTAIIQDARKNGEHSDIDVLRQISVKLKVEGLDLSSLAFATRTNSIMEENGINEDQLEQIIQEFATYRLRHELTYDIIIKCGREALYLENKYNVPIEKIPEYITQGKKTIDRLEDERRELIGQVQLAKIDRDAKHQELSVMAAKIEKYKTEVPLIQRIIELENKLEEAERWNKLHEISERSLTKERNSAGLDAMRLERDIIELDASWKEDRRKLYKCQNELAKLSKAADK